MKIQNDIKINQFGQNLLTITDIINYFDSLEKSEKDDFIKKLIFFILQLKPTKEDVESAIKLSGLKETYTPIVLIKLSYDYNNLNKIINLPDNEFKKSLSLLLALYFTAYQKQFTSEGFFPTKWWLNDLSNYNNIIKVEQLSDFRVILKKIYNSQAIETGTIMTALIEFSITLYEKNLIEKRLELYAFNNLYPQKGLNIYKSIYSDTASLIIIKGINDLAFENINLAIY
ncbi:DUF5958 family protein [Flavobacterium cerinum]|uniref:DUF5958 family protein n=1 Tax=Flavobacterium cerinum TaxID=2502784 RepID=A0ABY5INU4_9FLAO|nr:DUF5958 family protein [Flavobacterium cerinum]UUC43946.1 DUF5958 family protein [Flavobacterium cerinum]